MAMVEAWDAFQALWSDSGRRDPYPHLRALSEHAPVFSVGPRRVLALGYDECDYVLRHPELFRVCDREWADMEWPTWREHPSVRSIYNALMHQEPPGNQPARKRLAQMLGPRRMDRLRPLIEEQAREHVRRLRSLAAGGGADAVDHLLTLPNTTIGLALGVPKADLPRLRQWSAALMEANDFNPPGGDLTAADAGYKELHDYLRWLVAEGRPGLATELATGWTGDQDGLLDNLAFLIGAGTETASVMLGTGLRMLVERPELRSLLVQRPDLVPSFVQETLRYDPPAQLAARWTLEPTTLGELRLPRHCLVMLMLGAAGRDHRHFDDPDRFDPYRFAPMDEDGGRQDPPRLLSFGVGPHFCVGSGVAMLTGEIVFPLLARACEGMTFAEPPVHAVGTVIHGYERLRVTIRKPALDTGFDPAVIEGGTLPEALRHLASKAPDTSWVFPAPDVRLAASELYRSSLAMARGLCEAGVRQGERVGLLLPTGPQVWQGLFATVSAGAAATMLPVRPLEPTQVAAERLARIVDSAGMRHIVAGHGFDKLVRALLAQRPRLRCLPLAEGGGSQALPEAAPDDLAVVQYTSGSTAFPKGVTLRHGTVLAGLRALLTSASLTRRDSLVQWVPHHHDMGLFTPLAYGLAGLDVHTFAPLDFVRRPAAFLEYLERCGGTTTTGPDFGYALLNDAARELAPDTLDLGRWRLAYNGAEPVRAATVRDFTRTMDAHGVSENVMFPVYGLAEATLAATFPTPGNTPRIEYVDRDRLADGSAVRVPRDHERAKDIVSVGRPVHGMRLRLAGHPAEGATGEIQLAGDAVTPGYLNAPEANAAAFDGSWFRTGDLGVRLDGDLFVVGRTKDLIIVSGRNYFPEDAEAIASAVPGVHRDHCVAFGDTDEHLVVAAESLHHDRADEISTEIRNQIRRQLGLDAVRVRIVPRGMLPRTTSGKWRRNDTRDLLANTQGDQR
ncbi:Acyl-CoA synthetase (AMP-forming)/AMP-acid ligase II [Nonomuraea solani]|uniref:Acyl-CoA synthetase (AMP-forming)/AMP-acid ligase II n=1 Tax=Nonomuraea solani TaxID=1144553 RepID=A0A1H6EF68_9ACTN|nr:cytochrome P450 [Nonomuraea solani]SEG95494.1 Acyl-CoA synthetase (AMP-forming)/AMP-acid ligase II [Nonomuraea solani]